ncbi:MAG: CFI-box-CTERM domain-containing protein, partial [Nitrosopumilus sp.]
DEFDEQLPRFEETIDSFEILSQDKGEEGGGCLIATATYGSELAPQVQQLREIRDNTILSTESGTAFMAGFNQFYYSFSPAIADLERENPMFKEAVKITLTPLLASLSILNHVDVDSEVSVLGYGISLIILNIGMYFAAPAIIIYKIRK